MNWFQPDAENCANILVRLKMVSSLFSSLDTKCVKNSNDGGGDQSEGQPVVLILATILPMLKDIAVAWASDESVTEVNSHLSELIRKLGSQADWALKNTFVFLFIRSRKSPNTAFLRCKLT